MPIRNYNNYGVARMANKSIHTMLSEQLQNDEIILKLLRRRVDNIGIPNIMKREVTLSLLINLKNGFRNLTYADSKYLQYSGIRTIPQGYAIEIQAVSLK